MNLLSNALGAVGALMPLQTIKIINETIVNNKGFTHTEQSEILTQAHIQPLTSFEVSKITQNTTEANIMYKFYIIGDLANVKTALNDLQSFIIWDNKEFLIYSKNDYSLNGWIQVIGALKNV